MDLTCCCVASVASGKRLPHSRLLRIILFQEILDLWVFTRFFALVFFVNATIMSNKGQNSLKKETTHRECRFVSERKFGVNVREAM